VERHVTLADNVDDGFIPSLYAAPGRLHLFYSALRWLWNPNKQAYAWTPVGHAHLGYDLDAPETGWQELPRPLETLDPEHPFNEWFGAFDHATALERPIASAGPDHYLLHFVCPYTEDPIETGPTHLVHTVWDSATGEWSDAVFVFSPDAHPETVGGEVFEYPSIGVDEAGRRLVAFRLRTPDDGITPRMGANRIVVVKGDRSGWDAEPMLVLGRGDGGIGAYRAVMAKPDGLRSGVFDFVWAASENFSRADLAHHNTLNGYREDGAWHHSYPIYHALAHRRIVLTTE
jgi:hypothetical protein